MRCPKKLNVQNSQGYRSGLYIQQFILHQAGEIFHHRVIQIVSLAGYILYDAIILQHADNAILDLSAITGYGGSCVS